MTTDDLRTRAREAASEHLIGRADFLGDKATAFIEGYLAHAAQQPTREQIARALERDDERLDEEPSRPEGEWYLSNADAILALFDRPVS